jgi:Fic family protein
MEYNWQHPDWPNFVYDGAQCKTNVYQYALEAGRLSGGVGQLLETQQYEAYIDLMVCEAIASSEIEGQYLSRTDIRSSVENNLGLNHPQMPIDDAKADGIGALMVDVRRSFGEPLTRQKLLQWHELAIGDDNPAEQHWRETASPMRIVSGKPGAEKVRFEAPPSERIDELIGAFLDWYNRTNPMEDPKAENIVSGPVRAAIAHLWFESIHPFESGNGRVGRALAEQALAHDLGHPPLLSLSSQILNDLDGYYEGLNNATKPTMDITAWVNWFTESVLQSQHDEVKSVNLILKKAVF